MRIRISRRIILYILLLLSAQHGFAEETGLPATNAIELLNKANRVSLLLHAVDKSDKMNEHKAWNYLCLAKNSRITSEQSDAYANAIKYISDVTSEQESPPSAFLLASRIYRHKGGISYAKNYFTKAAAVYLDEVMQKPGSVKANLDAAIILYAGDVRYWDTYNDSKQKAFAYADKVLELYKNKKAEKSIPASEEIFLEEAAALAFLIKENVSGSNAHFAKAENIWLGNDEKTNSSLIKMVNSNEQDVTEENIYAPYALFKEYPQQGKWLWPVANQTEARKEFLLNCLTGFYTEQ